MITKQTEGLDIKLYVAEIVQVGTAAPTPKMYQNSYGGTFTVTRTGVGEIDIATTGIPGNQPFTNNQTFILTTLYNSSTAALARVTHVGPNLIRITLTTSGGTVVDTNVVNIEIRTYSKPPITI